jgi:hypothetical protein
MKEDIPLSAKLIADELKSRISSLTGVKLLPDFIGRNKYKVLVSN